jgi:bZIP transcription factor
MLPPPPPGSALPGTVPSIVNVAPPADGSSATDRERHLAWLRDLNAIAKGTSPASRGSALNHQGQVKDPPAVLPDGHSGAPAPNRGGFAPQMHAAAAGLPPNHPGLLYGALVGPPMHRPQKPAAETAEKRAKRLERNRESARKSRRRKKERLSALEEQVNKLHAAIEVERRIKINVMVGALRSCRATAQFNGETNVIFATGPCSEISRAVLDFQYTVLRQLILPRYHKALLWFTLQQESFFYAAKEEYANRENMLARASSGKVSSKQIGDEMTNGVAGSSSKKRVTFEKSGEGDKDDKPSLSPHANDGAKVWPLFCYELSFSVDQEDRFVAAHKKLQESSAAASSRAEVAAAVRTGDRLREAVESLSRRTAEREQHTLNGILSQPQVAAYQQWLASNRDRCVRLVEQRTAEVKPPPDEFPVESSLDDICQRLNEVLQISNPERETS